MQRNQPNPKITHFRERIGSTTVETTTIEGKTKGGIRYKLWCWTVSEKASRYWCLTGALLAVVPLFH